MAAAASTLRRLLVGVQAVGGGDRSCPADVAPAVIALLCARRGPFRKQGLNSRIELGVINNHNDASVC